MDATSEQGTNGAELPRPSVPAADDDGRAQRERRLKRAIDALSLITAFEGAKGTARDLQRAVKDQRWQGGTADNIVIAARHLEDAAHRLGLALDDERRKLEEEEKAHRSDK